MNENTFAFPWTHDDITYKGMTLRDYFAAKAMQGMFEYWDENPHLGFEHIASCSYDMADAMLKARESNA
jgi:alpha-N-acetylglucosamine transferase